MALINHAKREINAKIVYYGREGAGKRSSLQYIYDRIKPSLRGDLKSPSASGDSLFFFDFSPFEKPMFGDYRIRFHVYTLPGRVANPAAWKMTLKGADGLVIVADASPEIATAERETISVLRGFLAAYGVGLHDIPCVLQLAKGSSPHNTTAAGMAEALDLPNIQVCLSEPSSGEGVLATLSLLSREILTRIGQDEALRLIEGEVTPADGNDAEVSAAILSLDKKTDGPVDGPLQVEVDKTALTAVEHEDGDNQLQVKLAVEGATCKDGVIRVPLEFMHAGSMSRLVVSIAIDHV
jgi:signal recognition particle receptor subunit beta